MTRLVLWLLLSSVAGIGAFFGAWSDSTAAACTFFSALALGLHSLFGEEA